MPANERQKEIIEHIHGMVRVDAGPGTGKTRTIVDRYVYMLQDSKNSVQDILMVTFTKNAAEEMAERLRAKLKEYALSIQEDDPSKSELLLHSLNEVRTSTFDAYCLHIVLNNTLAVSRFFNIDEVLSRGAVLVENQTLNNLHFERFYRDFTKKNAYMFRKRGNYPAISVGHEIELFELISKLMSRGIIPLGDYEWFTGGEKLLRGDTSAVLDLMLSDGGCPKISKFLENISDYNLKNTCMEAFTDDELRSAAEENRDNLVYFIHDVYYGYIRESIISNRLTFGLSALFAFAALYEDEKCREKNSFKYMMVDEFQDTNEMQMMICLMMLSEPNLCVVGDWKQGIYGFRYVSIDNITKFSEKAPELIAKLNTSGQTRVKFDVEPQDVFETSLEVNYRSSQKIIDASFEALHAKGSSESKEVIDTSNIVPLSSEKEEYLHDHTAVEIFLAKDDEEEMTCLMNQITQYMESGRYQVQVEKGEFRKPRFGDICILFRRSKSCNQMYKMLCDNGIPAFLQGDMEIMSSRPGKLALAWLRYVNDENDRRALTTILADFNLSMAQIELIYRSMREAIERKEDPNKEIPKQIWEERKFLMKKRKRPNDLLTSMFAWHCIGDGNPAEADMAQAIINVISTAYSNTLMTIPDMIRLIEDDIANGTKYNVDAVLDRDAVMIQTMHKSKGLEYPIVLIGDLTAKNMPLVVNDDSVFRYSDITGVRCMNEYAVREDGGESEEGHIYKSWRSKAVFDSLPDDYSEERRLLFVAISRAKQYVTMTGKKKGSAFLKHYMDLEIDRINAQRAAQGLPSLDAGMSESKWKEHKYDLFMNRIPAWIECETNKEVRYSEPPLIPEYKKRRKNLGVHDIMTYVPGQKLVGDDSDKGREYGRMVHNAAHQLAMGKECDESIPEVPYIKQVLASFGNDPLLPEKECALPIGDVTLRGVIDLLVNRGDRMEIHDWKTDTDDRNLASYRLQLSVYYHAVAGATGLPAECYLDFVSLGKTIKVEPMSIAEIEAYVHRYYKSSSGTSPSP